jgi:hypothetical protein
MYISHILKIKNTNFTPKSLCDIYECHKTELTKHFHEQTQDIINTIKEPRITKDDVRKSGKRLKADIMNALDKAINEIQ